MKIKIVDITEPRKKLDEANLGFGNVFTNRMFSQKYIQGQGWTDAVIGPYQPFILDPATAVFHYAQEIFEGAKAYRRPDGLINVFRLKDNMARFNRSALRMAMPPVDENVHFEAIVELVKWEHEWVPCQAHSALYLRPVMIATDAVLGVRASKTYLHYVILSPVVSYFKGALNPISVYISDTYRRAVRGGTGEAKTGGNYAASLLVAEEAGSKGYSQVLWLDAITGRYIEEVGAMNIFFVYEGKRLVTPSLTGSILPGITRDSILVLARDLGYEAEEALLDVHQILADIAGSKITEIFGCGTAAVVAPIGKLGFQGTDYVVNNYQAGPVASHLFAELSALQRGEIEDRYGWTQVIHPPKD